MKDKYDVRLIGEQFLSAIRNGENISDILSQGDVNVNYCDEDGWTAIMIAAHNGQAQVIESLHEQGADVNATMLDGRTAVMIATQEGHEQVIRTLKGLGANINARKKDGCTAVMIAAHYGNEQIIRMLQGLGADVNSIMQDGWTAMMIAAHSGQERAIRTLNDLGADVGSAKQDGWNALMSAAQNGQETVIRTLVDLGANVNATMQNGGTAVMIAAQNDQEQAIRILYKLGAKINSANHNGKTPLDIAKAKGNVQIVNILEEMIASDQLNSKSVKDSNISQEIKTEYSNIVESKTAEQNQLEQVRKRLSDIKQQISQEETDNPALEEKINANEEEIARLESIINEKDSEIANICRRVQDSEEVLYRQLERKYQELCVQIDHNSSAQRVRDANMVAEIMAIRQEMVDLAHIRNEIDPRVLVGSKFLAQQQRIELDVKQSRYYNIIHKAFNEAFLFAAILSQGDVATESDSKVAPLLAFVGNVGDSILLPMLSKVLNVGESAAYYLSDAKRAYRFTRLADLNPTSSPFVADMFSAELAQSITIANEMEISMTAHHVDIMVDNESKTFSAKIASTLQNIKKSIVQSIKKMMPEGVISKRETELEILASNDANVALMHILTGDLAENLLNESEFADKGQERQAILQNITDAVISKKKYSAKGERAKARNASLFDHTKKVVPVEEEYHLAAQNKPSSRQEVGEEQEKDQRIAQLERELADAKKKMNEQQLDQEEKIQEVKQDLAAYKADIIAQMQEMMQGQLPQLQTAGRRQKNISQNFLGAEPVSFQSKIDDQAQRSSNVFVDDDALILG